MAWLNLRTAALILAALVTAFWLWFGIASATVEQLGWYNWVAHILTPGGILLVTVLLAWKWEALGGTLLAIEGIIVGIGYPILTRGRFPVTTVILMLLTLALPPLAAGIMLLVDARRVALRH